MAFDLDFYFVKCKDQHDHLVKYDPFHLGLPIFHIHNNFHLELHILRLSQVSKLFQGQF